jgi:hypothetical protein
MKKNKLKLISTIVLICANVIAILRDSWCVVLAQHFAKSYSAAGYMAVRCIPLIAIGILLAVYAFTKAEDKYFIEPILLVLNALLLLLNLKFLIFRDYTGIAVFAGFCIGAAVFRLKRK